MTFSDARKLDWDKTRVKGKKSFILMRGVFPFALGSILAVTSDIFVTNYINSKSSFSFQHMIIQYFGSLIFCSLCGGLYANSIWKSNVKNFDK
ncbi:hypothetical protein [Clostridium manihotivorum]|uniref:Uncharacterized protein n=1 Tax=Clostridium manihotivorum TaxID=2320868 RepID=A0A3R5U9R1_9CLOT|nr:hypothetical protein [Clostridium manihotivorum]QAA33014.1 hypothetical protein C1I91_15960 [Clostridium manihotivorum]